MICKECGSDVSSSEVFCPNCGAPLRVTADYDYIQAEIGGKVDQVLNDEDMELRWKPEERSEIPASEPELTIIGEKKPEHETPPASSDARQKEREREKLSNTLAVTRTLYVKDSIFADEEAPDLEEIPPKQPSGGRGDQDVRRKQAERKRRAEERAKKKKRTTILVIVLTAIVVIGAVIGILVAVSGKKAEPEQTADVITANVENGGSYSAPLEVTLWSDQDSRLVYTLDGSEPGISTGTKYGGPFTLTNADIGGESREVTLIVFGYKKEASIKTGELRLTFTLVRAQPGLPEIDVPSGDYYGDTYISISAEEGTTIYYTYDGSTPSTSSTRYTGPIEMKRGSNVLSAIAVDGNGVSSEVASAVYNLIMEAAFSYDEAFYNVMQTLVSQGLIESTAPDTDGYYKVPGGGKRRVINGGTALVENTNYYVIQVDYMNDGSSVQATTYYGVNDQTGEVIKLNRSGMTFILG